MCERCVLSWSLARFRPDDLRTQDGLVESQLAIQLRHGLRRRLEVDDGVDALGPLVDLVREAPAPPDVELLDRTPGRPAHIAEIRVERRGEGAFLETAVEDHHDLVMTQDVLTSYGLTAAVSPRQEVVRRHRLALMRAG